ncbi:MAG: transposase [Kiritimatiellae bacterium]|nr:transposase [Kiritimatiellia bacterium]
MRRPRIKDDGTAHYHCISRAIEKKPLFGQQEKARFHRLMRMLEDFCGVRILTYAIMQTHFHLLLEVPEPRHVCDDELVRRVGILYGNAAAQRLTARLTRMRNEGQDAEAERLRARFTYRMYDLSEFMKTLKQRFSQWYNRREGRHGPLWDDRFKSLLIQAPTRRRSWAPGTGDGLCFVAAYIDLNPVRARVVQDPKDYHYCGYGEALGGSRRAREGLLIITRAMGTPAVWTQARDVYRQFLFLRGERKGIRSDGRTVPPVFSEEQVATVLAAKGKLSAYELLRCRIRYFSHGLALGSEAFIKEVCERYQKAPWAQRDPRPHPMKHGDWGGLCTMQKLRMQPVSVTTS